MFEKMKRHIPRSTAKRLEKLNVTLSRMHYTRPLDDLPDQLAEVLELYDRTPMDANYRNDIEEIISTTIVLSRAVLDPTFDSDEALTHASRQLMLMSKLLTYLANRPSRIGYSILIPSSGALIGQFATEHEANQHLNVLSPMGYNAVVTPVKITSQLSIRPNLPEPGTGPIPPGIIPDHLHDSVIIPRDPTDLSPSPETTAANLEALSSLDDIPSKVDDPSVSAKPTTPATPPGPGNSAQGAGNLKPLSSQP